MLDRRARALPLTTTEGVSVTDRKQDAYATLSIARRSRL